MMSSFQTGRTRGRDGAVAVDEPVLTEASMFDVAGTTEPMSADPAPELEDPRDH